LDAILARDASLYLQDIGVASKIKYQTNLIIITTTTIIIIIRLIIIIMEKVKFSGKKFCKTFRFNRFFLKKREPLNF